MSSNALTVVSGSGLPPAIIKAAGELPTIIQRLERSGADTKALERNLARAPLFAPNRALQLSIESPGSMYRKPFFVHSGKPLTIRDQLFLTEGMTHFVRDGCPSDLAVDLSFATGARWLGYESHSAEHRPSGWARQKVKQTLLRLEMVVLESEVGFGNEYRWMHWRLIDRAVGSRSEARFYLSPELAGLLRAGSISLVHGPTFTRLVNVDPVAARLWCLLESETLPTPGHEPFRFYLFGSDTDEGILRYDWLPALADLLFLRFKHRRHSADRLRQAVETMAREDARYAELRVEKHGRSNWILLATRGKRTVTGRDDDGAETVTRPDAERSQGLTLPVTGRDALSTTNRTSYRTKKPNSDSLTGKSPILEVLKLKGWKRPSSKQLVAITAIARRRSLGDEQQVATTIREQFPGRDKADLFDWLAREARKPSRPMRTIDDIIEPPPLLEEGAA